MNRRDPNAGNRQAGGYRNEDNGWDSPRQASQWQDDTESQGGNPWGGGDREDTGYRTSETYTRRNPQGPGRERGRDRGYLGDAYGDAGNWSGYRSRDRFEDSPRSNRDYRFSGSGEPGYPSRDFDASGGNDYADFTSEDYGGRDFSRNRSGLSGGMRSSNSYRPSYGPGSWSRGGNDFDDWRGYGEQRGFLQRAGDEIASWFGDEDASRRREQDHRGRGPSDYTRSDDRIREDVNDVLTHDWRVDASAVRVEVKDGEVTLSGTVDSRQAKRRAEDLADGVSGVRHVQNNLRARDRDYGGLTAGTDTPGFSHTATSGTATKPGTTS